MKLIIFLKEKISPEIKAILILFLVSRILLTVVGVSSRLALEPFHKKPPECIYSSNLYLDIWGIYDSGWYLEIARKGYFINPKTDRVGTVDVSQQNYVFLPLYPLLIKVLGVVTGNYFIAGLIISNISLLLACFFLLKVAEMEYGYDTALNSVKYIFLFPSTFILSGVFSESLFLLLLILCFYFAKKRNWLIVGLFGFCLSLTRIFGVLIILPLLYEYLKSREFRLKEVKTDALFLLLLPAGLSIFALYICSLTGDFLAVFNIHKSWGSVPGNPIKLLYENITSANIYFKFNGIISLIVLCVLLSGYKKIPFTYWLTGLLMIILPLSSGISSTTGMLRYMAVVFPLYLIFARSSRNVYVEQLIIVSMVLLQGFLMVFWTTGFGFII